MRVLVMDDDARLVALLQQGLRAAGFAVDSASDSLDGIAMAASDNYEVIIVDVMMPRLNGYKVCGHLRSVGDNTPILMLTAKDGEYDEAEGLETGADDYLTKPFSFVVLNARLRALIRRARPERQVVQHFGDVEIYTGARRRRRAGQDIALTPREFDVMALLAATPDITISKAAILDQIWDSTYEGGANIVEVNVSALRRKIDRPFRRASIETVPGGAWHQDHQGPDQA
ncbi:response regulator transcription factor [Streptomyces sp. NPDC060223]|uniref:response regulator transcription factor n=1 Tax=unclassified Streptomyces TaxID=2593676 RepID=UPI003633A2D7